MTGVRNHPTLIEDGVQAFRGLLVALEGLAGGLLNTLLPLMAGLRMIWSPAGLLSWCGSKQECCLESRLHTAAVLDSNEELCAELRVDAGRRQRDQLMEFAARFVPHRWAIEAATGWGALLAQQLVAAGEAVLDVPPG